MNRAADADSHAAGFNKNPSPLYQQAVAILRKLEDQEEHADRAFAAAICEHRVAMYMEQRKGRREESQHRCIHWVLGQRCAIRIDEDEDFKDCSIDLIPGKDHLSYWRDADGNRLIVSQPYSLSYPTLTALVAWCERWGLEADVSASSSWHFPGQTLLIEISTAAPRPKGESTNEPPRTQMYREG